MSDELLLTRKNAMIHRAETVENRDQSMSPCACDTITKNSAVAIPFPFRVSCPSCMRHVRIQRGQSQSVKIHGQTEAEERQRLTDSQSNELCFSHRSVVPPNRSISRAVATIIVARRNCDAAASKLGVAGRESSEWRGSERRDVLQCAKIARIIETYRSLRGVRTNPEPG